MDKTTDFISEIENVDSISLEQSFRIVSYCTQLLSQHSAEAELSARKIVIHVLNNWEKVDKNIYEIWDCCKMKVLQQSLGTAENFV